MILTTDILIADCILRNEKLDTNNINHIFLACNMALSIGVDATKSVYGFTDYITKLSEDIGVDLEKAPKPRQFPDEMAQELKTEIDNIPEEHLNNWMAFCMYTSAYCPNLWTYVYNYPLKDITIPRDVIELVKKYMYTQRNCLGRVEITSEVIGVVESKIKSAGTLDKLDISSIDTQLQWFAFLGLICEGLRLYNSIDAIEFESVLPPREIFISKVISELKLL